MDITQSDMVLELELFVRWLTPGIYSAEVGLPEEEKANETSLGYLYLIMFLKEPVHYVSQRACNKAWDFINPGT